MIQEDKVIATKLLSQTHIPKAKGSKRSPNFCSKCKRHFTNFSESTSIHGIQYLTEERSLFEKIFWLICIVSSFSGCIFMSHQIWYKYKNSPIVISFSSSPLLVSQIPFPAVTICPEIKLDVYKWDKEPSDALQFLCQKKMEEFDPDEEGEQDDETEEERFEYNVTEEFYKSIELAQTDFDNMIVACSWRGIVVNCSEIFVPIFTEEGLCYTFNTLDKSELIEGIVLPFSNYYNVEEESNYNIENGYMKRNEEIRLYYPYRSVTGASIKGGLSIKFAVNLKSLGFQCSMEEGFRVLIHNPFDIPSPSKDHFTVPFSRSVTAKVKPEMITTSQEVKNYLIDERQCYFQSERKLEYFKIYTQNNCKLECTAIHYKEICGCVEFYMPRHEKTPICGTKNKNCTQLTEAVLEIMKSGSTNDCNCLPLCTALNYDEIISSTKFKLSKQSLNKLAENNESSEIDFNQYKLASLNIYFKDEQFLAYERNELYGISDLISNFGGLLGLFTGFSLISGVEILYFLSLRILCNRQIYGAPKK